MKRCCIWVEKENRVDVSIWCQFEVDFWLYNLKNTNIIHRILNIKLTLKFELTLNFGHLTLQPKCNQIPVSWCFVPAGEGLKCMKIGQVLKQVETGSELIMLYITLTFSLEFVYMTGMMIMMMTMMKSILWTERELNCNEWERSDQISIRLRIPKRNTLTYS